MSAFVEAVVPIIEALLSTREAKVFTREPVVSTIEAKVSVVEALVSSVETKVPTIEAYSSEFHLSPACCHLIQHLSIIEIFGTSIRISIMRSLVLN